MSNVSQFVQVDKYEQSEYIDPVFQLAVILDTLIHQTKFVHASWFFWQKVKAMDTPIATMKLNFKCKLAQYECQ